jgi:hypothetical protein
MEYKKVGIAADNATRITADSQLQKLIVFRIAEASKKIFAVSASTSMEMVVVISPGMESRLIEAL